VWFTTGDRTSAGAFLQAMRDGLRELGYREGQDVVIETRSVESAEREQQMGAEIVASRPSVIVTQGRAARIVQALSPTVPVIFGFSGDPIEAGLITSFARPGGQFTGVTFLAYDLAGKRIEVLKEVFPSLRRIAVVASPEHIGQPREFAASKAAADRLGLVTSQHTARSAAELEAALDSAREARADALVVFPDPLTNARRHVISEFALRHRLPAISGWAVYAESGLLMTYGPNLGDAWRRVAYFVDRVLKGARPAELPTELPRTLEMVVNLKTARALGVGIPPSVLLRADRVIE
jgi:putative ABC transport system substrate-binding protein